MQSALALLEDIQRGRILTCSFTPPESVDKIDKTDKMPVDVGALRRDVADLHDRILLLRCEKRTRKADRPALLPYLSRRIERVAARCDLPDGYTDPKDEFADTALAALRAEFAELTAEGNPYPLGPLADDPFSMDPPRLYNGKLVGDLPHP